MFFDFTYFIKYFRDGDIHQYILNAAIHQGTKLVQCLNTDVFPGTQPLDDIGVNPFIDQLVSGYAMHSDVFILSLLFHTLWRVYFCDFHV